MKIKFLILILCVFLVTTSSCYKPKQKPEDFDTFWELSLSELGEDVKSSFIKDSILDDKKITLRSLESYDKTTIYLWVAEPIKPGKYPIFIRYSGFGRGNSNKDDMPNKWFLKQKNRINITVDIRGQGLSTDQVKFNGYLTKGLESKDKFIYKGGYLDAVKAVDFAKTIPNDGNIVVIGGSQGGALAISATALNPNVTMCVANFPFLTDIHSYDKKKWPMKIWLHETKIKDRKLEDLHQTLSYFDILNFANKINVPFFSRTQEEDTITPKEGAMKLFNTLNSKNKNLYVAPCKGHGCSATSKLADKMEKIFIEENLKK